ncbi:hypothetical protein AAY473_019453 [Plecturocebus cupreus]
MSFMGSGLKEVGQDMGAGQDHFGRPKEADCLSSGVQDQPGKHGETPCLPKTQKISQTWRHTPVVPAALPLRYLEIWQPRSTAEKQ